MKGLIIETIQTDEVLLRVIPAEYKHTKVVADSWLEMRAGRVVLLGVPGWVYTQFFPGIEPACHDKARQPGACWKTRSFLPGRHSAEQVQCRAGGLKENQILLKGTQRELLLGFSFNKIRI